jgi:predicted regulator of amino acid metabolism with ACT domain
MNGLDEIKTLLKIHLEDYPISEKKLSRTIGVDERTIRLAIVDMIEKDDEIILSNSKGVWKEHDPKVVLDYCAKIQAIGMAYMKKQADLKKNVSHKFPQLGMSLGVDK